MKSKNITLNMNTEITELEHKISKYLGINKTNSINYNINREKVRKNSIGMNKKIKL